MMKVLCAGDKPLVPIRDDVEITEDGNTTTVITLEGGALRLENERFASGELRISRFDLEEVVTRVTPASHGMSQSDSVPLFVVQPDDDGTHRLNNIPIFRTCENDPDRPKIDQQFLDSMVENFGAYKDGVTNVFGDDKFAWLPKVHVSHTVKDGEELQVVGFVDNLRRIGDYLFCDFRYMDEDTAKKLGTGRYPDRSCEVDPEDKRLLSVALLGSSPPYFKLPQMRRFEDRWAAVKQYALPGRRRVTYEMRMSDMAKPEHRATGNILLNMMTAEGIHFNISAQEMYRFVETYEGSADELYELIRKMVMDAKVRQVNKTEGSGHGYTLTLNDMQQFVQSDGHKTATAGSTQPDMTQAQIAAKNVRVTNEGEPATAPRHGPKFSDDPAVQRYVESLPEKSQGAAKGLVEKFQESLDEAKKFIEMQGQALQNMEGKIGEERTLRKENEKKATIERFRAELIVLRTKGCVGIGDKDSIEEHLSLIMDFSDDEKREKYMEKLQSMPTVLGPRDRTQIKTTFIEGGGKTTAQKYQEKYKNDKELRARMRRMGVTEEQYAICMGYADLEEVATAIPEDDDIRTVDM